MTAVDLTRNPVGLARALERISADPEVLEVANRATQHLYIVNPIKPFEKRASSLWDTHPPIAERIATLEADRGPDASSRAGFSNTDKSLLTPRTEALTVLGCAEGERGRLRRLWRSR